MFCVIVNVTGFIVKQNVSVLGPYKTWDEAYEAECKSKRAAEALGIKKENIHTEVKLMELI